MNADRLKSVRLGCVKYLNARPLIHGWPEKVVFDHPATLCAELARGDLDVALVSSFEFLRNPIYRIVDGISISSNGPVYSVVLAYSGQISGIEEIELDPASETSANLLRCLVGEGVLSRSTGILSATGRTRCGEPVGPAPKAFGAESQIAENISVGRTGNMPVFRSSKRARLLIGDQAIRFRQEYANRFQFWDLGQQWRQFVDLPFVYALWLVRPEVADPKEIANRLRALRDDNLDHLDRIIAAAVAGVADPGREKSFDPEFCARYYREHLQFGFGQPEKEGLRTFANLCAKHGLLPQRDLALDLV